MDVLVVNGDMEEVINEETPSVSIQFRVIMSFVNRNGIIVFVMEPYFEGNN